MKQIKFNFHSFVDVITNSSTMTYIMTDKDSIKNAKKFINNLLKIADSDKTADDLFDFKIELDEYVAEDYQAYKEECEADGDEVESIEEWIENRDGYTSSTVIMTIKDSNDKKSIDLANEFTKIFNLEASADY